MIKDTEKIRFRLLGKEKSSMAFQVPLKNLMLPRTKNGPLKRVEFIRGHDSIFAEDHEGDEKAEEIWFEEGVIDVHPQDKAMLEIMRKHPWNGVKWEEANEDKDAQKEIDRYELIEKAQERVRIANLDERRAAAIVLLGKGYFSASEKKIEAGLKREAIQNPTAVIEKMNSNNYTGELAAALALIRGVVEANATNTQIVWSDTRKPILNVAMGQDVHEKFGQYLSGNSEDVKITLQEIGQKIKRDYTPKAELDMQKIFQIENGKVDIDPEAKMTIEEAREKYKEVLGKDVPVNMKNDLDWIVGKIAEELQPA
jgi:hypothetical protein